MHLSAVDLIGSQITTAKTIGVDAHDMTSIEHVSAALGRVTEKDSLSAVMRKGQWIGKMIPIGRRVILLMHGQEGIVSGMNEDGVVQLVVGSKILKEGQMPRPGSWKDNHRSC